MGFYEKLRKIVSSTSFNYCHRLNLVSYKQIGVFTFPQVSNHLVFISRWFWMTGGGLTRQRTFFMYLFHLFMLPLSMISSLTVPSAQAFYPPLDLGQPLLDAHGVDVCAIHQIRPRCQLCIAGAMLWLSDPIHAFPLLCVDSWNT
jgi:hypothetical protein